MVWYLNVEYISYYRQGILIWQDVICRLKSKWITEVYHDIKIHCRDKGVVTCRFSMFCQCLIASYLFSVNINAKNRKTNTKSSHLSGLDFPNRINLYEFFILVVSLFNTRKVIQFVKINVVFQSIYVYWISFDSFTVVFY